MLRSIPPIVVGAGMVGANCYPHEYERTPPDQVLAYGWPAEHTFRFVVMSMSHTGFSFSSSLTSHWLFEWERAAVAGVWAMVLVVSALYIARKTVRSGGRVCQFSLSHLLLLAAVVAAILSARSVLDALIALRQKPMWIIAPVVIGIICAVLAATCVANNFLRLLGRLRIRAGPRAQTG